MRELSLRVRAEDAEAVLDRLLPLAPHGIHEIPRGQEVELRLRGGPTSRDDVQAAAGEYKLNEREVPDDWRERRALDFEPDVIGGRIAIRPPWAPEPEQGIVDVVLETRGAFGGGEHPTTRLGLEELLALEPGGSLADLGSGSGVLAITAAHLGFAPVTAVELEPIAAAAIRANALLNGVEIQILEANLMEAAPPAADVVLANVPPEIHERLAPRLEAATLIASGILESTADATAAAYERSGLREIRRRSDQGWVALVLSSRTFAPSLNQIRRPSG